MTFYETLADGINNQGLFVGPSVPNALEQRLDEMPVAIDAGSASLHAVHGRHPDGHPLEPLTWLANFLAQRQRGLRAGQIVTTGSYCGVVDVPLNTQIAVRFGALGVLTVEFEPFA